MPSAGINILSGPKDGGRAESYLSITWRQFRRNKGAMAALGMVVGLILIAVCAPVVAPYDPTSQTAGLPLSSPSLAHPLGTDGNGRDMLSRIIFGTRISLRVGLISVGIGAAVGISLGLLAGYYSGWVNMAITRFFDLLLAFPGIFLALAVVAALGSSLFNTMIALGIAAIPTYGRLITGVVLSAKRNVYVDAARTVGASDLRIMVLHILPNCIAPVIVQMTLGIGYAILGCASLSFLGLGAQPPEPEWGALLASGRNYLRSAWWISVFPGMAIMIAVLAANMFGDGLRDALDPRLKN